MELLLCNVPSNSQSDSGPKLSMLYVFRRLLGFDFLSLQAIH